LDRGAGDEKGNKKAGPALISGTGVSRRAIDERGVADNKSYRAEKHPILRFGPRSQVRYRWEKKANKKKTEHLSPSRGL